MSVPSKGWTKLYQAVAREMGVPPRGPRGCEANMRRSVMAPAVVRETNRRWKARRHKRNDGSNS